MSCRFFAKLWSGMLAVVSVLALVAVSDAFAQSSPDPVFGTYRVTGVAANDSLNVRDAVHDSGSVLDAPVVGTLGPRATGVIATGRTATVNGSLWREIIHGGIEGWVNARFLAQTTTPLSGVLPDRFECGGTEPFWSAELYRDRAELQTFDGRQSFVVASRRSPTNHRARWAIDLRAAGSGARSHAVVLTDQICSDGMSDADYPMEIIWLDGEGTRSPLQGCCSAGR